MRAIPGRLQTFQLGSEKREGEGLRVAVTRSPPRGVHKEDWPQWFDVWFPVVAPSTELLHKGYRFDVFSQRYANELHKSAEVWQSVVFLALLASRTPISIGCYCEDESGCHRSVLKAIIEEQMED